MQQSLWWSDGILLRPFPYLGSAHLVFNLHVLRSCACSIFTCFSFMSFLITSFRSSYLSVSTHFHVLITTSSSVSVSTWPNHLSLASFIVSFMFATPAFAHISSFLTFSILFPPSISTFSSLLFLASFAHPSLSAQVSLPYIRTGLMTA